jgi:hypothetical protein
MNPIELSVVFLDGSEKSVSCIAADLVAFESKFDISVARLEKDVRITHLFFLAWHALHRTGETKDDFEKWVNSVAAVQDLEVKK